MSMSMTVTMASMVDISTRNTCTRAASIEISSASERTFLAKREVDACNPFQKNLQTLQPSHQQLQCRAMLQISFEAIALATPRATSQCMVGVQLEAIPAAMAIMMATRMPHSKQIFHHHWRAIWPHIM